MHPAYILLAVPFFFLLMGIEWLYGRAKQQEYYRLNDSLVNLTIGIGSQVFNLLSKGLLFGVAVWIKEHYGLFNIPATWWSFVLCLVAFDFFFYWAHRWGHEVNIFWGAHSVHHQSEEYNLSVALRQSWFHNLLAFVIFLPIPLLGFDVITFGAAAAIHTLYQFWIHTKTIGKLPDWFEYIFNTPSHHRVHHAVNPKYIDRNHAGVFMIWDRLYGTFKAEEDSDEIVYGITTPLKSWNPAWANVHYYVEMFAKARNMNWRDKLRLLVARPGWLPEAMGGFQAVQEPEAQRVKYDADTNSLLRGYAIIQFIWLLLGSVQYMRYYETMSPFYRIVFFLMLFVSMLLIGALFERRKWVQYAEYARLALVVVALNTFYYFWFVNWFAVMMVGSCIAFVGCVVFFTYILFQQQRELKNAAC